MLTIQDVLDVKNPFLTKLSAELHKVVDTDKVWVHDDSIDYPIQLAVYRDDMLSIVMPLTFGYLKITITSHHLWGSNTPRSSLSELLQKQVNQMYVAWYTGKVGNTSPIVSGKVRRVVDLDKATLESLPRVLDKHIGTFIKALKRMQEKAVVGSRQFAPKDISDQYHGLRLLIRTAKIERKDIFGDFDYTGIERTLRMLRDQLLELKGVEPLVVDNGYFNKIREI